MPIRINLLAEAQAAEEARRRDPVKRGIWVGGFLVCLVLIYVLKLYGDILLANMGCSKLEESWTRSEPKYNEVITNQVKISRLEGKLTELNRFSTNRFLWGTVLNVLQQTTVENVEMTSFRGTQKYTVSNGVPSKVVDGKTLPRKPGVAIEEITLSIEARDWDHTRETYRKYKDTLSSNDFFAKRSGGFKLGTINPPGIDVQNPSRSSAIFTLDCHLTEVTRSE